MTGAMSVVNTSRAGKPGMARVTLVVPSLLRDLLGVPAGTVPALRRAFPKLTPHLWDETGALRKHVQVYVGEWNVRWTDVPDDVWHDGARVRVAMAVSGG